MTQPLPPLLRNHSVYVRYIPEVIRIPDKRLGRNVKRDSRADLYNGHETAWRPLVSRLHSRDIPILNQGDVGSCTGNAETGALGSDPCYGALSPTIVLDEAFAQNLYSAAEILDGDGPYPPNDNGSTGPSVSQAAKNAGLISHYKHCFTLLGVLHALAFGPSGNGYPVILGTNWYDSMDKPDSSGLVSVSPGAVIRGGHEYLCRGLDVDAQEILCDNSWGTGWGEQGSFYYSWATLERLLSEEGDGCVGFPIGT